MIGTLNPIFTGSYEAASMTPEVLVQWAGEIRDRYKRADSHIGLAVRFLKWVAWRDTHPEWVDDPHMTPKHLLVLRQRRRQRELPGEIPVLTPKQVGVLVDASRITAHPHRNAALISLIWDTGFRIGEALSMRVQDVFEDNDPKGVRRWYAYCPRSKTVARRVVLHESIPVMKDYLGLRDGAEGESPLWPSRRGGPLDYHSWKTCLNTIIRKATGIDPTIRFPRGYKAHLLRHSRATYLANQGWNEAMLMKRFGWIQSGMAAYYVEQTRIDTGAAFDKIDRDTERRGHGQATLLTSPMTTGCQGTAAVERCPYCGMPLPAKL